MNLLDPLALLVTAWFLIAFGWSNTNNVLLIVRTWPLLSRLVGVGAFLVVVALAYTVLVGLDIPTALHALIQGQPPHATWGSIARTALIAAWFTGQSWCVDYVTDVLVRHFPRRRAP